MDLTGKPHFIIGIAMSLGLGRMVGLAINEAISIETDIIVNFSELSL